jgi:hypothetical protein
VHEPSQKVLARLRHNDTLRTEFNNQFPNLIEYLPGPAFTVSTDDDATTLQRSIACVFSSVCRRRYS